MILIMPMRPRTSHAQAFVVDEPYAGDLGAHPRGNPVRWRCRPLPAQCRDHEAEAAHVDKSDYEAVYAGMTRCSKYSGHDQAAGVPADLPKFADIKADLDKLSSYVKAANNRRKTLEKEGKVYEEGPMMAEILD